jgi:hypothetical protein
MTGVSHWHPAMYNISNSKRDASDYLKKEEEKKKKCRGW